MRDSILDALLARFCAADGRARMPERRGSTLPWACERVPRAVGASEKWIMLELARFEAAVISDGLGDNPMSGVRLVPFTGADLQAVEAWFDDPETCRWLGDRRWPEMILRLEADPPAELRGHRVIDRRAWIIEEGDVRVGMIDVEIYADRTASLALVVAPAHRGHGVARRGLDAIAT